MKEFARVVKFTLFSISAGLIEMGAFALLNELLHLPLLGELSGRPGALRAVELHPQPQIHLPQRGKRAGGHAEGGRLLCRVYPPLSTWLEHRLAAGLGWNEYLVTGINMVLNFVTEFLYQRFFVFGKTIDTKTAEKKES